MSTVSNLLESSVFGKSIKLGVNEDGTTIYHFPASQQGCKQAIKLQSSEKGLGIVSSCSRIKGEVIFSNIALACVLVGSKATAPVTTAVTVCKACCAEATSSSASSSTTKDTLNSNLYCSDVCSKKDESFRNLFGVALSNCREELPLMTSAEFDSLSLLCKYLFEVHRILSIESGTFTSQEVNAQETNSLMPYLQVWNLNSQALTSSQRQQITKLWEKLQSSDSSLKGLKLLESYIEISELALQRLLGIILCNAQMIPVYSINPSATSTSSTKSNSFVMTLLPTIPRVNHSCSPNASIVASLIDGGSKTIKVSLLALKDLKEGEEITMSYLQDHILTSSEASARQELLQQNAQFTCFCSRCQYQALEKSSGRSAKHPSLLLRERRIGEMLSFLHQQFIASSTLANLPGSNEKEIDPEAFLHEIQDLLPRYEILLHEVEAMLFPGNPLILLQREDDALTMLANALVLVVSPAQSHLNLLFSLTQKKTPGKLSDEASKQMVSIAKLFVQYYKIVIQASHLLIICIEIMFGSETSSFPLKKNNIKLTWASLQQLECILNYVLHISMFVKFWMTLTEQFHEFRPMLFKEGQENLTKGEQVVMQAIYLLESTYRTVLPDVSERDSTTSTAFFVSVETKDQLLFFHQKFVKLQKYLGILTSKVAAMNSK